MKCPVCGMDDHKIVRNTATEDGFVRRRMCNQCGSRWTTIELDLDQYDSLNSSMKAMRFRIKTLEAQVESLTAKVLSLGGKP